MAIAILDVGANNPGSNPTNFTRHKTAQALQFTFAGRVVAQELVGETDSSERQLTVSRMCPRRETVNSQLPPPRSIISTGRSAEPEIRHQPQVNKAALF